MSEVDDEIVAMARMGQVEVVAEIEELMSLLSAARRPALVCSLNEQLSEKAKRLDSYCRAIIARSR